VIFIKEQVPVFLGRFSPSTDQSILFSW